MFYNQLPVCPRAKEKLPALLSTARGPPAGPVPRWQDLLTVDGIGSICRDFSGSKSVRLFLSAFPVVTTVRPVKRVTWSLISNFGQWLLETWRTLR